LKRLFLPLLAAAGLLAACDTPQGVRDNYWGQDLFRSDRTSYKVERDAWGRPILPAPPKDTPPQR